MFSRSGLFLQSTDKDSDVVVPFVCSFVMSYIAAMLLGGGMVVFSMATVFDVTLYFLVGHTW